MEEKDLDKTSEVEDDKHDSNSEDCDKGKSKKKKSNGFRKDISFVTKGLLTAILYIALNLDRSDIQLSHISRFINEGRLSIQNCSKFIPRELNTREIPRWSSFIRCTRMNTSNCIRNIAMSVFKKLDLGTPLVPDLKKLIDSYITELCLPKEFKSLVFSLIHLLPCDFLEVDNRTKKSLVRIPDFEGVAMAYILIGLKMSFGLDDDYEVRLSEAVEKINNKHNYMKTYKLGKYSDRTDRLFSFREWCNFLQFRKTVLAKYYLPVAERHDLDVDDQVFMEHLDERSKRKIELGDQVTMDILNKIPLDDSIGVIAKSEFPATLTPMTTYTEVVLEYLQDHDQRLLLSEDFTQYSLKYACKNLQLPFEVGFPITGVSEANKTFNSFVVGTLVSKKADSKMVYVRNCENKNWLKTKPPNMERVDDGDDKERGTEIIDIETSDKDSDHGYDSNIDNTPVESKTDETENNDSSVEVNCSITKKEEINIDDFEATIIDEEIDRKLETIEEEESEINIFDDTFEDIDADEKKEVTIDFNSFDCQNQLLENSQNSKSETDDVDSVTTKHIFNPETFNREQTIKELILAACKKYKIPVPPEYNTESRKRKNSLVHYGANDHEPKKKKIVNQTRKGEAKKDIDKLLSTYYANLEKDFLADVSQHVKSVVNDTLKLNATENPISNETVIDFDKSSINRTTEDLNSLDENVYRDKTLESSIIESNGDEEFDINDLLPKGDPKFDAKTHDIEQLYVKFNGEINLEDLLDFDDVEINKIIDKKIMEAEQNELITLSAKDTKKTDEYDSEDDVLLSVHKQEKYLLRDRKKQRKQKLFPLISHPDELPEFKYWFRHYSTPTIRKTLDMSQKFDLELKANCPKSFNFVLYECASILDCTAFSLYKWMQNLEELLLGTIE